MNHSFDTFNSRLVMVFTSLKSSNEEKCYTNQYLTPFKDYFIRVEILGNGPLNVEYHFTGKLIL